MKIIFLDIDGVLNGHQYIARSCLGFSGKAHIEPTLMKRLNRVIQETGAKIVLTSAWRYYYYRGEMTLLGLQRLLESHGLFKDCFFGGTKKDEIDFDFNWSEEKKQEYKKLYWNERSFQILEFLKINVVERYVVIDDVDAGFTEAGLDFVKTDPNRGISNENATRAIKILNS